MGSIISNITRLLIESIETGVPKAPLNMLIIHASKNKVLLELLRKLKINNELRYQQEKARYKIFKTAEKIANMLEGLEYAFFKLAKPVAYVPADIDILIEQNHLYEAIDRLTKKGYKIDVLEPYTLTLRGPPLLDFYVHPTISNIIYLNGQKLLKFVKNTEVEGYYLPVLDKSVEALISAVHAIYKEGIYTLNDYITVTKWASHETFRLAKNLCVEDAVSLAVALAMDIKNGMLESPFKLPMPIYIKMITAKIIKDSTTRTTLLKITSRFKDRRTPKLIITRIRRITY